MKTIYTSVLAATLSSLVFAQPIDTNWTRSYHQDAAAAKAQIAEMPNGNYLVSRGDLYYQINLEGDLLDSTMDNTNFGQTKDMVGVSDGVLLAGSLNGHPAIAKIDSAFNIVWSKELSTSNGEASAVFVDGSDYFVSGYYGFYTDFIAKFDANGDTAWMTLIPQSTFSKLSDIIKLSDGNYLASGNWDDYPLAVKFNSSGDTLWTYQEVIFISFQKMNALERSNGNIWLVAEHHLVELDANGNKLSNEGFSISQFYDLEVNNDTVYLFGHRKDTIWGSERRPVVELRTMNFDSLGSFVYENDLDVMADNEFVDAIRTPGGGYITVGKKRPVVSNNDYQLLAMKFNDGSVVGLPKVPALAPLTVYPNPTVDQVMATGLTTGETVSVYDLQGRVVLQQVVLRESVELDLKALECGNYVVRTDHGQIARIMKH